MGRPIDDVRERFDGSTGTEHSRRLIDTRTAFAFCEPAAAFAPIRRIGGRTGWYYATWLWTLRGLLDRLLGGPGLSHGRDDPDHLSPGALLDCWRVDSIEENRCLRLRALMKMPGRGWLQFRVEPNPEGCTIEQTATFEPRGLFASAYWYALYPLHRIVFGGMIRALVRAAEEVSGDQEVS